MNNIQTNYIEISLSEVIRYFAKDFTGYINHESFVDTTKNTIIFKLTSDISISKNLLKSDSKKADKVMKGKAQHTCFNQFINSKGNKVCACGNQVMPDGSILVDKTTCNICKKLMKRGHTKCIPKN